MNSVRSLGDVIYEMVSEYLETVGRMAANLPGESPAATTAHHA